MKMSMPLSLPTNVMRKIVEKEGTTLSYAYKDMPTGKHGVYMAQHASKEGTFNDGPKQQEGLLRGGKPFEFHIEQTPLFLRTTFKKSMCPETRYAEEMYARTLCRCPAPIGCDRARACPSRHLTGCRKGFGPIF